MIKTIKMKQTIIAFVLVFGLTIHGFSQTSETSTPPPAKPEWKLFSEIDLGLLATSGGYSNFFGVRRGPHSFELGYEHFPSPDAFGGTPDGFDMTVEYIYAVHYAYFWGGKKDKGLYTRLMYQNKKQIVTEKSSSITRALYSNLVGAELGYVLYFYKGLYVAPRLGALYYLQSPQGKDNDPVLVGSSYYDNDRHKTWDTYFIPTLSLGFSLPLK
jgi:hypothetical protein